MNKIESYVDSVIPKNIPKSKQQKLRAELEAHIFDRIDFYTEIGYDNEASIDKAISDMGEDEKVKSSIRNNFEELHFERTWWAVATGLLLLVLNFVSVYVEAGLFFDFNSDSTLLADGHGFRLVYSFTVLFAVIVSAIVFYNKGLRKCLLALGISNLLTLNGAYVIGAVYSFCRVMTYLVVKDSEVSLSQCYSMLWIVVFSLWVALIIGISVACFIFSGRLRKEGRPKKRFIGMTLFCVFYLAVSIASVYWYPDAEKYLSYNPDWFSTTQDTHTAESQEIYNQLSQNTTNEQLHTVMDNYGYVSFDEYEKNLDKDTLKKFRHNVETLDLFVENDYQVWFDPQREASDISNGFVFVLTDENGTIKSKGVGNAFNDVRTYSVVEKYCVIEDCVNTFLTYDGGENKQSVLEFFAEEQGTVYGEFTTYTENGENNYYRIYCTGLDKSGQWMYGINSMFVELWFENGKLSNGKMHYSEPEFDEKFQDTLTTHRYYTLAD